MTAGHVTGLMHRWYQGRAITVALADGTVLPATAGQPILTQRGWVTARAVSDRDYLVIADPDAAVPFDTTWATVDPPLVRTTRPLAAGLWGDTCAGFNVEVVGSEGPCWTTEGSEPPTHPARAALAALCTPGVFGVSTWEQACAAVPGLSTMWPLGEPCARGHDVPLTTRTRLGEALSALPASRGDVPGLAYALVGLLVDLALVKVEKVEPRVAAGWFATVATSTSTMIANRVLAGTAP